MSSTHQISNRHPISRWTCMLAVPLAVMALTACGDTASLNEAQTTGANPQLPEPKKQTIPTLHIAPAVGWTDTAAPRAAPGLGVMAMARGLDHPRWIHVLPNGDVLVAESSNPPKPEGSKGGIREWVMGVVMKRAGSAVPSADRITLLRDTDGDGVAETRSVLLDKAAGLMSPFGMALIGNTLYVANADSVVRFPYTEGTQQITQKAELVSSLPAGINHHWTKNLIASADGSKLYITVGSNSNVGENGMEIEDGRAAVWELDVGTGQKRVFATGLRNPNGLAWEPTSGALWTVVNERDEIGSDLVPDYLTSVKDGAFYGWPYSYWGRNVDQRIQPQKPELVAKAIAPDYALGNHVAPLGLAFMPAKQPAIAPPSAIQIAAVPPAVGSTDAPAGASAPGMEPQASASAPVAAPAPVLSPVPPPTRSAGPAFSWPDAYASGAFVGQHGSWNRKPRSGYNVVFVPFAGGKPTGAPVPVLDGFVSPDGKAYGRPVGVAFDARGALLVADDVGNAIWRVAPTAAR